MIIIDSDNYDSLGIETMFFPGGEPHVKLPKSLIGSTEEILLHLKLRTWGQVGLALCLGYALQDAPLAHAFIPYFPGARQDKTNDRESECGVDLYSDLLGNMAEYIHIFDPHSKALEEQLEFTEMMPCDLKGVMPISPNVAGIIAPDRGAWERACSFRDAFYPGMPIVVGHKERDPRSGKILNYSLEPLSGEGTWIIVDDICDAGGTFNLAVREFEKDKLAKKSRLEMFVSHGIFSHPSGVDNLDRRIEKIITTDSWCAYSPYIGDSKKRLTILPLLPTLLTQINGDRA